MANFFYTCKAIVTDDGKKIKCTINVGVDTIQILGHFRKSCTIHVEFNGIQRIIGNSNIPRGITITFSDFCMLSTALGKEKIGFFEKDYVEIRYGNKSLRKVYFKNISEAQKFAEIIKEKKERIDIECEEKRKEAIYIDARRLMLKWTIEDLKRAIRKFQSILDWKDSKNKIDICNKRIAELEEKRKESIYKDACMLMSQYTFESLKQAVSKFQSILDWKESKNNITICNKKIAEFEKKREKERKDKIYNDALSIMQQDDVWAYKKALSEFKSISPWKDAQQYILACEEKIDETYKAALILMSANTIEDFEEAIRKFQTILEWEDSQAKIVICKSKISEIRQKLEEKRKDRVYHEALALMNINTIESYEHAVKKFTGIISWRDSKAQVDICNSKINDLKRKNEEIRKNKIYQEAIALMDKNTIADYEHAITKFNSIQGWLDANIQVEVCKKKIKRIREAAFWEEIKQEAKKYREAPENIKAHIDVIKRYSKSIFELFLQNPYFILGLSCTAEQSKMLDVKDKIEKFARLKLANAYKSSFDLKNIEKPSRDISNVQSAIVSAKELKYKWLWFSGDEYCGWWESDRLFEVLEKQGKDDINYDLLLACYLHMIVTDVKLEKREKWNTLISYIDYLLNLPSSHLVTILRNHINYKEGSETIGTLVESFAQTIVSPFIKICENADSTQLHNLSKIKHFTNKNAQDGVCSSIIMNLTNRCYPLENSLKSFPEHPTQLESDQLIELAKRTETDVYGDIDVMVNVVGQNSTYAKRIKKKYKDVFWSVLVKLHENNRDVSAIPFAKTIYPICSDDDKQRLVSTFGYETFGLQKPYHIPHEHYDLGTIYVDYRETKIIEVELNYTAYVRLLSDPNYKKYIAGGTYNYYGGRQTQTPCRIKIPSNGHWHVVVDNDGEPLGSIKSLSCYTRTISNY